MTKLLRTASAALALALVPGFALADSAPGMKLAAAPAKKSADSPRYAVAPSSSGSEIGSIAIGGNLGLDFGGNGYGTGFRIQGNGYYTLLELAPKFMLDLGGDLDFIYNGCSQAGISCHLTTFEIVPTARFRYHLMPQLSLYGDAGLGLAFASATVDTSALPGGGSISTSATGGVFRIAGGVLYQIGNQLYLVGEPMGLNFYFYDGSAFHYSIQVGVQYRFQ